MDWREAVYSDRTTEIFIQKSGSPEQLKERYGLSFLQPLGDKYVVAYVPDDYFVRGKADFEEPYSVIPKCFASSIVPAAEEQNPGSTRLLEETGVGRIRRLTYLDLYGQEVMLGFIDSGIDYLHPAFRNRNNTSRIHAIWDQTVENGNPPEGFFFGQEYRKEQLDEALQSEMPQSIVPEQDEVGTGTFLAGVAAGNTDNNADFSGIAPLADIAVVKLKPAKRYLRELFLIPDQAICYAETDIALGVEYLVQTARKAGKPLVICMSTVSNAGGHNGDGILEEILNHYATSYGICIVTGTGNEALYGLHYRSSGERGRYYEEVELRVGEGERGFVAELWADELNRFSVSVVSPTGELVSAVRNPRNHRQIMRFLLEPTVITLDYQMVEGRSGTQLIVIRMEEPAEGIWRLRVEKEREREGGFDIWLPLRQFMKSESAFVRAEPEVTITAPGNAFRPITVTAYRSENDAYDPTAGRGLTREGRNKPDIAAPGIGIYGPLANDVRYAVMDGTGAAVAVTAGICALLLQWIIGALERSEYRTEEVKRLLKGGADSAGIPVPNRIWGYGRIDLFGALEELRDRLE